MIKNGLIIILFFTLMIQSCKSTESKSENSQAKNKDDYGIQSSIPVFFGSVYQKNFTRYTKTVAPNGKAIHILAQSNLSTNQILRARGILEHYLTDFPGSRYGADKSAIANKMADNNAILLLLNGSDGDLRLPAGVVLEGQPLYQNEIQTEGGSWYINQDYSHRDGSFEEILHLVHDYGIGVDGPGTMPGGAPAFQQEIRACQVNALNNRIWGITDPDQVIEWRNENSLSQEYLASVIDAYYGLWGAEVTVPGTTMWGDYLPGKRAEIAGEDPSADTRLLSGDFFHPYLTYNARIESSFTGTFHLRFHADKVYTNHSQYLKDITLTGSNNSNVEVNQLDNNIKGNSGYNIVIFSGVYSEYSIIKNKNGTQVQDKTANRDGTNILNEIEELKFSDQSIRISDL